MTKKNGLIIATVLIFLITLQSCSQVINSGNGKLFIIGGGEKSSRLMNELVDLSGIRKSGYMVILPMASASPDSSIIWTRADFDSTGITDMPAFNFRKGEKPSEARIDSLRNAKLIFIGGGDQEIFMETVRNTPVMDAIIEAWHNGAVISGTSAGAAVMSSKMITGNQKLYPGVISGYSTIESGNIEIMNGLGFLKDAIIDQHFVKRQRLNRLISVSIENPDETCIGIDESTAIIVDGNTATVSGRGQVVVIKNPMKRKSEKNSLLGTEGLNLSVYLPGERFRIK